MSSIETTNQVRLRIRVRYAECDAQQVVFNARYADYADLAATEYIRALIGNHQKLLEAGFDNQVVSLHIDWMASAKFDDVLELQVSVAHIGTTSFRLQTDCYVVNQHDNKTQSSSKIAQMQTTYVVVDSVSYEKRPIPAFLHNAFARVFDVEVNQAG